MSIEIIARPDRGKHGYRLRCRFTINRLPAERWLEQAKYAAAERFVVDMRKQGFEYLDAHGFKMTGPFVPLKIVSLPSKAQQEKWHLRSTAMLPRLMQGEKFRARQEGFATNALSLDESEEWEFELAGVFVHDTILTEMPDPHEERETLRSW